MPALVPFHTRWTDLDFVWIDFETTGVRSRDRAIQVGIARMRGDKVIGTASSLIDPEGVPITPEAGAIHGITAEQLVGAPTIAEFFARAEVVELMKDAQPAAYNAPFDRRFAPLEIADPDWPWADALSLVRVVDRYARGKGRHKLVNVCERHGITLTKAHDASADAMAAGQVFLKFASRVYPRTISIGELLKRQRLAEAEQWADHHAWRANQPPLPEQGAST